MTSNGQFFWSDENGTFTSTIIPVGAKNIQIDSTISEIDFQKGSYRRSDGKWYELPEVLYYCEGNKLIFRNRSGTLLGEIIGVPYKPNNK